MSRSNHGVVRQLHERLIRSGLPMYTRRLSIMLNSRRLLSLILPLVALASGRAWSLMLNACPFL